jgi:hypothetical protein
MAAQKLWMCLTLLRGWRYTLGYVYFATISQIEPPAGLGSRTLSREGVRAPVLSLH